MSAKLRPVVLGFSFFPQKVHKRKKVAFANKKKTVNSQPTETAGKTQGPLDGLLARHTVPEVPFAIQPGLGPSKAASLARPCSGFGDVCFHVFITEDSVVLQ